ncbi:MAG TPA: hypothetical protein VKP65_03745, partial [Rhodothermales bacterium]|nr:hypothetical protein [Rhodothermales bacterium]
HDLGPETLDVWDWSENSPPFDGFIGHDFFEENVVCVDFPNKRIFVQFADEPTDDTVATAQTNLPTPNLGPEGLHRRLIATPEGSRNHILGMAIQDAGFRCDEVGSSRLVVAETGAWHTDSGGIASYMTVLDESRNPTIEPSQNGNFGE